MFPQVVSMRWWVKGDPPEHLVKGEDHQVSGIKGQSHNGEEGGGT
jgi:hypothetical protein